MRALGVVVRRPARVSRLWGRAARACVSTRRWAQGFRATTRMPARLRLRATALGGARAQLRWSASLRRLVLSAVARATRRLGPARTRRRESGRPAMMTTAARSRMRVTVREIVWRADRAPQTTRAFRRCVNAGPASRCHLATARSVVIRRRCAVARAHVPTSRATRRTAADVAWPARMGLSARAWRPRPVRAHLPTPVGDAGARCSMRSAPTTRSVGSSVTSRCGAPPTTPPTVRHNSRRSVSALTTASTERRVGRARSTARLPRMRSQLRC